LWQYAFGKMPNREFAKQWFRRKPKPRNSKPKLGKIVFLQNMEFTKQRLIFPIDIKSRLGKTVVLLKLNFTKTRNSQNKGFPINTKPRKQQTQTWKNHGFAKQEFSLKSQNLEAPNLETAKPDLTKPWFR